MRYIKEYNKFSDEWKSESSPKPIDRQSLKTKEDIEDWLKKMNIKNYNINKDLTVDVYDNVNISKKQLKYIPIQFRTITNDFYCNNNRLISLEGCPSKVDGDFRCNNNQLTSLEFGPYDVEENYECEYNQLTSLKGCPDLIKGDFRCNDNIINTLEYCPIIINRTFFLGNNKLKNLEGCCPKIGYGLCLENNCLESLKGCPDVPDGTLILFDNNIQNLKDIENCNIKKIAITGNPVNDILDLYFTNDLSTKLLIKYINDYNVIKGNNIILESLKEAMYMADVEFHHYINDSNIQNYIKHYTVI